MTTQTNARMLALAVENAKALSREPKPGTHARQSTYLFGHRADPTIDVTSTQPDGYNWAGAFVSYIPDAGGKTVSLFTVRVPVEGEGTKLTTPQPTRYGAFLVTPSGREVPLEDALAALEAAFPRESGHGHGR